ncbi:uncharacterized protein Hap1MRO34_026440 [Clarias gariepinus]
MSKIKKLKIKKPVKYHEIGSENVQKPCEQFEEALKKIRKTMKKTEIKESKVILFYIPIVSRAGTDIEAALQKLKGLDDKHVVVVVLHHTFDKESVVPDSSRAVNRKKTITVDCLFHEDEGLLKCQKNDDAVNKVAKWIHVEVKHPKNVKDDGKTAGSGDGATVNGGSPVSSEQSS